MCVAIIDGMAFLQSLDKPHYINTCEDLSNHFLKRLQTYYNSYDEVQVVFDRYNIPVSLENATRQKRLRGSESIAYHITDNTRINNITIKTLLPSVQTKEELTAYLANKIISRFTELKLHVIVAWREEVAATHITVQHLRSSHEEADTKLILHAADATLRGASTHQIQMLLYWLFGDTPCYVLEHRVL